LGTSGAIDASLSNCSFDEGLFCNLSDQKIVAVVYEVLAVISVEEWIGDRVAIGVYFDVASPPRDAISLDP
jgi:hypothetical protein